MTLESARHAVVLGATGAVGSALLGDLVRSDRWETVTTFGRRAPDRVLGGFDERQRARVRSHVIAMESLEEEVYRLLRAAGGAAGWAGFCTLGVGQPRKLPREEVWRVDVEYAGAFARGCSAAGVTHLSLLSSVSADADSRNYYLRVKGSAESAVASAGCPRTSLFRPSLLVTPEPRYGLQDRVSRWLLPKLSPVLPSRFHEIRVEDLARAMRVNAERPGTAGVRILHWDDCMRLIAAGE